MTNENHTHQWRWYPGDAGREAEGYWHCRECNAYRDGWGVTPDDGIIEPDNEPDPAVETMPTGPTTNECACCGIEFPHGPIYSPGQPELPLCSPQCRIIFCGVMDELVAV